LLRVSCLLMLYRAELPLDGEVEFHRIVQRAGFEPATLSSFEVSPNGSLRIFRGNWRTRVVFTPTRLALQQVQESNLSLSLKKEVTAY
jgi:hypothetical protein